MTSYEKELRAMIKEVVEQILAERGGEFLTVKQYAKRYALSVSTVRDAIANDRLDSEKFGRARRIPAEARIAPVKRDADDIERRADEVLGLRRKARR